MSNAAEIAQALQAPFAPEDLKQRPGRGGLTFTYADARAVAQRLDDTLGCDGWSFEVAVADPARSVVKGSLALRIDGKSVIREDFGYPNSAQDDEPLKSAASDALRRCAAQSGVGRSLYSPDRPSVAPVAQMRHAAPRLVPQEIQDPPVAVSARVEALAADFTDPKQAAEMIGALVGGAGGACPKHGTGWTQRPGGVSKATGKPYAPFWTCTEKDASGFCKQKPSIQWLKENPIGAPAAPKQDASSFDDIPF